MPRDKYNITPENEQRRRQAISDAAKRMREGKGFLYVAEVIGTDTIKIGYTLDVANREKTLKTDHRVTMRMLAHMPATIMDEKRLHRRLRKARRPDRVGGCWTEFYHRSVLSHEAIPAHLRRIA